MRRGALFLIAFLFPLPVFAGIFITEIMYNPAGDDTDREWVEIYNDGAETDLTGWKFSEDGVNHGLAEFQGSIIIPNGGYAIIVDVPAKFLADFPLFSGTILDSSFALENTDTLIIKDKDLNPTDTVTYDSATGGANDGNSIQKSGGSFLAATPTPGTAHSYPGGGTQTETQATTTTSSSGGGSTWSVEPQIFAEAGKDRVVVAGAAVTFEGRAYGLKKEPLENTRYVWNFGDGTIAEGKMVDHTYRYPGDYLVVLDVASGYFAGSDTLKVRAEPSPLSISAITNGQDFFVEIKNSANQDIDIGGWILALGEKKFFVPKNTFVLGGKKLIFGNEITGLPVVAGSVPELRYPNGILAHRFGEAKVSVTAAPVSIETKTQNISKPVPSVVAAEESRTENEAQLAATAKATSFPTNYIWHIGVLVIALVAIGGVIFFRRLELPRDETEKLADEFEIIEDK